MRTAVLALKPAPGPRSTTERWQDAVAQVTVKGDLDRDALWAIDFTLARASAEAGRIVLDLLEVTHLDYAGVGDLVARRRELNARGGELSIVVRNPYVTNILRAAGGADLLIVRSVAEASGQTVAAGRRGTVHALPVGRKKGP
ncbi:MAG: STAS domain-containing protein [Deltaproteobacteria bacterium]|nr:STAS domain-containing protein [Deltaproteobacteria bacterium]